jgi:hypothetical protein
VVLIFLQCYHHIAPQLLGSIFKNAAKETDLTHRIMLAAKINSFPGLLHVRAANSFLVSSCLQI